MLARFAQTSRTPDVLEFMRALARTSRLPDIVEAIDATVGNCEINRAAKREFLHARVPGILTNNHFTSFESAWYEAFIAWTARTEAWASAIAAARTGDALAVAVAEVRANVDASR